jgi:hypothetical protein
LNTVRSSLIVALGPSDKLVLSAIAGHRQGDAGDPLEVTAMSSPGELTFVVGRGLRPMVVLLDVVRRIGLWPTSSREQRSTALNH